MGDARMVTATLAPSSIGGPDLDIDASGGVDALTDGALVLRRLLGLSDGALTAGVIGSNAQRSLPADLADHFSNVLPILDIDGDGRVDGQPTAC